MKTILDKIKGCLIGGAIGDALGYPAEFMSIEEIMSKYGSKGIRRHELDNRGLAVISDDTQMSLFTANGILYGATWLALHGKEDNAEQYVENAYEDWYYTQSKDPRFEEFKWTWIRDIPELNVKRSPGNTCLMAISNPIRENDSKGCGGIMRSAPMAMYCAAHKDKFPKGKNITDYVVDSGEYVAKITHHHPLGYITAGFLNLLLFKLIYENRGKTKAELKDMIHATLEHIMKMHATEYPEQMERLSTIVRKATALADDKRTSDIDAIRQLGEGWVAEENLAIAIYCTLRHNDSFEDAVCASVNHSGDSDSTGSVCGNIMGTIYGEDAIPEYYKEHLELRKLTESMAHDLYTGCIITKDHKTDTPERFQWYQRYCEMTPAGLKGYH